MPVRAVLVTALPWRMPDVVTTPEFAQDAANRRAQLFLCATDGVSFHERAYLAAGAPTQDEGWQVTSTMTLNQ